MSDIREKYSIEEERRILLGMAINVVLAFAVGLSLGLFMGYVLWYLSHAI